MNEIKEVNLSLVKLLKLTIEIINIEFDVNMCLFQLGIEPLSIIDKDDV